MNNINCFLFNLSNTCKRDSVILEDGMSRSIFGRIRDFFRRKKAADYFTVACSKLSEAVDNGAISQLSIGDRIEIFLRMKDISEKLKGQDKDKCLQNLQKYEKVIFKDKVQQISIVANNVFEQLNKNSRRWFSKDKVSIRGVQTIRMILDYHKDNSVFINSLFKNWKAYRASEKEYKKKDNFNFIQKMHLEILKLFVDVQEQQALNSTPLALRKYNETFFLYLEELKQRSFFLDFEEIEKQIQNFSKVLEKNKHDIDFIKNVLVRLNMFFDTNVFGKTLLLDEKKRYSLEMFSGFFEICNTYLENEDSDTKKKLRLKFVNLPSLKNRENYKNLNLTRKDQVQLLSMYFQEKEDQLISQILESEDKAFSLNDLHQLAKLANNKSELSDKNRGKLRQAIIKILGKEPESWVDYLSLKKQIEIHADTGKKNPENFIPLKRTAKAKIFFQNQLDLEEQMIHIPRWYHATNQQAIGEICFSNEIQVRHEGVFPGAWVSSKAEWCFGDYFLALNDKIHELDTNPIIGFLYQNCRWRGLKKAIPLKTNDTQYLTYVGVPLQQNKMEQKIDKLKLVQTLKNQGFSNPIAFSSCQLEFMRRGVVDCLGHPNLPPNWWGKEIK